MEIAEVVDYVRRARLAVVSTVAPNGRPEAALVGVGATDALEIVFDTVETTRKHANLTRRPRAAIGVSGPGERTLQLEGRATSVSTTDDEHARLREAYYLTWPDGRDRLGWAGLAYWCVTPDWARFTDYERTPSVVQVIG